MSGPSRPWGRTRFNHRVLRPWARDPAFYQSIWTHRSDVPAHEGPTRHAVVELWVTGIRNLRQQRETLGRIAGRVEADAAPELAAVLEASRRATDELVAWLEAEAPKKTGPSGIGKDAYTWYQQNVHLVPMSWEDELKLVVLGGVLGLAAGVAQLQWVFGGGLW